MVNRLPASTHARPKTDPEGRLTNGLQKVDPQLLASTTRDAMLLGQGRGACNFRCCETGDIMRIDPFGLECVFWCLLLAVLSGVGLELMF